jgi:hypothetical protein
MVDLDHARDFIYGAARLLDRLWFAALFEGAEARGVVRGLAAYQNEDGGFGHGLEPDTRTPLSQPLNVLIALEYMADAGAADAAMIDAAVDFLARVSPASGGAPILLPGFERHAHAPHWKGYSRPPELVPNAAIVGLLYKLRIEHPWRDATAERVWKWIDTEVLEAHAIRDAAIFLESAPDRGRAQNASRRLAQALPTAAWFKPDPLSTDYGLTPLAFAPTPGGFCRSWFNDVLIGRHLDQLASDQQEDGGWPISWNPPGPASVLEWRGMQTVKALRTLKAYGRI